MSSKIHYEHPDRVITGCGLIDLLKPGQKIRDFNISADPDCVTCKKCQKHIKKHKIDKDEKDLYTKCSIGMACVVNSLRVRLSY